MANVNNTERSDLANVSNWKKKFSPSPTGYIDGIIKLIFNGEIKHVTLIDSC